MKKMLYTSFLIDHITRNDGRPSRDPPKRGGGHEGPIIMVNFSTIILLVDWHYTLPVLLYSLSKATFS